MTCYENLIDALDELVELAREGTTELGWLSLANSALEIRKILLKAKE